MNADGSGVKALTNDMADNMHFTSFDSDPSWSPDGTKIAFERLNNGVRSVFVMNSDGTGVEPLAGVTTSNFDPRWSPDGTRIVFSANGTIFITNSDGSSGFETLPSFCGGFPRWSPDGTKILFSKGDGLYVVDLEAGRSNLTKIYDESPSTFVGGLDWQRLLGVIPGHGRQPDNRLLDSPLRQRRRCPKDRLNAGNLYPQFRPAVQNRHGRLWQLFV